MGINLYLDENLSDKQICQLLDISETAIEMYQKYLNLENQLDLIEDVAKKYNLEQSLYNLTTTSQDLSRFIDYKLSGLGRVSFDLTQSYNGSTKDSNRIKILLAAVGQAHLTNKVKEVYWG